MKVFQVGGSVRDELLGVEPKDRDWVVVNSSPEEMEEKGFKPIGKDFPVFLHPETNEEYALARTERKSGVGYKGFEFYFDSSVSLEDDLKRRDFTINSIAKDENGNIIDPFKGRLDLQNKIFKHTSPAFEEDPLRVLRFARFKSYEQLHDFNLHEETEVYFENIIASKELKNLSCDLRKNRKLLFFSAGWAKKNSPGRIFANKHIFFLALEQGDYKEGLYLKASFMLAQ